MVAFEDLIYLLTKYRFIHLYQIRQFEVAKVTLDDILAPMVEKEQSKGGMRAQWFATGNLFFNLMI